MSAQPRFGPVQTVRAQALVRLSYLPGRLGHRFPRHTAFLTAD